MHTYIFHTIWLLYFLLYEHYLDFQFSIFIVFADDPDHGLHSLSYICCCLSLQLQLDLNLFFRILSTCFQFGYQFMPSIEWLVAVVRIIRVHNTRAATDFVIFHIVVLTSELFSKKNLFKKE